MIDKKIILIIEDEDSLVFAYKTKFEKAGYTVWFASDGDRARAIIAGSPPDMVLLDLVLPWTSGFDLLQKIKETATWKNVPVLVLTNLSSEKDIERIKELGANEYLIKANIKINDIVKKVEGIIGPP